jgi:Amt family ammonium transporter
MAFDVVRGRRPSAIGSCVGAVVGLVAITPAAGYVSIGASILIGTVASIISNYVVHLKSQSTLDDTLDVFPCHGVGGIVGMVATGIFAREVGLLAGSSRMFLLQLAALVIAGTYTFVGSWLLYKLTDAIIPLRVPEEQERVGLDLSQHGESIVVSEPATR